MKRTSVILIACVFASAAAGTALAQTPWQPRDDLNEKLPPSIRVFELDRSAHFLWAWYAIADPADTSWMFRPVLTDGNAKTVTQFSAEYDALIGINGGYFGGGVSYSFVGWNGQILADNIGALTRDGQTFYPTRGAFGLLQDDQFEAAWIYRVGAQQYAYPEPSPNAPGSPQPRPTASLPEGGTVWPFRAGIGGGPMLVMDGEPRVTWEEEVFFGGSGVERDIRQARTAIGRTEDGKLIFMVVDGGVTLPALADMMIEVGALEALNLDGGGSSTFVVDHTLINRPGGGSSQRPVATAVLLVPRVDETDPEDPEYQYFDSGDECCYRERGGWFESANAPWYGDTRSRIVAVGDGSAAATFVFEGIEPGTYYIEALWSLSNNRATNTPFTIFRDGYGTTVRVNQTTGVNSPDGPWNNLGRFQITAGDSLVISNDATGNVSPAYVVADAVRIAPEIGISTESVQLPSSSFEVYPNPAGTFAVVELDGIPSAQIEVKIFDLLGRMISQKRLLHGENRVQLDTSTLAAGAYLIQVSNGLKRNSRLLMVMR